MIVNPGINITIGFDFGSSTTKVCYRLEADRLDKQGVVRFSNETSSSGSLFRDSVVYISSDLQYIGWKPFKDSRPFPFFKSLLIDHHSDPRKGETIREICAYFLASVLATCMQYIQYAESKHLNNKEIRWLLNFGLPVERNQPDLEASFKEVVNVAILLNDVVHFHPIIRMERWKVLYKDYIQKVPEGIYATFTPELLAEVINVFEDPEVEQGLSMIIDVGSATVDIAVVDLDRRSSEAFYLVDFISAKVGALGVDSTARMLGSHNSSKSYAELKESLQLEKHFSCVYNMLKDLNLEIKGLEGYGDSLLNKFRGLLAATCMDAKATSILPRLKSMRSIPLYLLGGGNTYHWYKFWPKDVHSDRLLRCGIPRFSYQQLYCQKSLPSVDQSNLHRFRVASGLTKQETMLKVSGYPWHFDRFEHHPFKQMVMDHDSLELIKREKYGN
jgi:hypothetical protein